MPQPLVALQTTSPQFDDPVNLQVKAYSLRNLASQAQAADQARTDDQAARAAFAANPDDSSARLSALAGVSPAAYAAEAKRQADLAKTGADTQAKQLETAHKKIDLAGQAFGYVRQFPTKDNAVSAVNWLGQNGVLSPDQVNDHLAKIDAATPDQIQGLATQAFQSAVAAKDQLNKIETKDAGGQIITQATNPITNQTTTLSTLAKTQSPDNIATNQRIAAEGEANRKNALAVQDKITERVGSGDDTEANIDPKRMAFMVDQALKGDTTVYQNLGRGKQGAANLLALRGAVADEAQKRGLTGADLAAINADYQGQKAGLRSASQISAKVENAGAEADQLAPLAIEAGRQVARSGFLPFGRAQVMFNNQTNDPAMNKFATANIGLATAYAGAMARGGKATVTDNEHARELLSTAKSQEAYEAIVSQMQQEIAAAKRAPKQVRDNLRNDISGKGHGAAPAASSGTPSDIADLLNKYGGGQ
jgi:hypothetical protein